MPTALSNFDWHACNDFNQRYDSCNEVPSYERAVDVMLSSSGLDLTSKPTPEDVWASVGGDVDEGGDGSSRPAKRQKVNQGRCEKECTASVAGYSLPGKVPMKQFRVWLCNVCKLSQAGKSRSTSVACQPSFCRGFCRTPIL